MNPLDSGKDILFGSIAGSCGKFLEYPLDTIKVRLQSQPINKPLKFVGAFDCIKYTYNHEGFASFYKGLTSPLIGSALENAILFVVYNSAQDIIKNNFYGGNKNAQLSLPVLTLCGSISGIFSSFVLTPVELIKCNMQVTRLYNNDVKLMANNVPKKSDLNILPFVKTIFKKNGVLGFWSGQLGTLSREFIGDGLWFGSYEVMKRSLNYNPNNDSPIVKNLKLLISGATAGMIFNLSIFPIDSVKSKVQTYSIVNSDSFIKNPTFSTIFFTILKNKGIRDLYTGLGITLVKSIPSNAGIFLTYENLKLIFN
ncbi:mitochondrial carrier [Ascoidea rubescens DSM 1968]|uniref:Mitochondrial carrier n=1 Tax=Ascoidea rubescens DSM 1968 TaxID=1344418 RepID=A0A1D2V9C9_9ASCO|nr:mitochondrial carrier [Ascoidea rubescens DSM 1968]ODV58254.1 mitochondrial carrier [Ascoidea rubescens DSM 1968]